jgi:hypothetical protein
MASRWRAHYIGKTGHATPSPHILAMKKSSLQPAAHAAAEAYGMDMARRGASEPFGSDDDGWLAVASLLGHAASHARDLVDADALLGEAYDLAEVILTSGSLGTSELAPRAMISEAPDGRERRQVITQLADRMESAGALNLAATVYHSLSVADPLLPVDERGRLVVFHERVLRKLGRPDEAMPT